MPLPLILGIGATATDTAAPKAGERGVKKMRDSSTMRQAQLLHRENVDYFEAQNKMSTYDMDVLGKKELEIIKSLGDFEWNNSQEPNRPLKADSLYEEMKGHSKGASILLGGIGSAAMGAAGGFAAAGAVSAAAKALAIPTKGADTAPVGDAAATNAVLAALSEDIPEVDGRIALGTTIFGAALLGAGLVVGPIIFNVVGTPMSRNPESAYEQVRKERDQINLICDYLQLLGKTAKEYHSLISAVYQIYQQLLSPKEQENFQTASQLAGLLYRMCAVRLVLPSEDAAHPNRVNVEAVKESMEYAKKVLSENNLQIRDADAWDWS